MEDYYERKEQRRREYLNSLDSSLPLWAKKLVELYTSPLKYEVMYELKYKG